MSKLQTGTIPDLSSWAIFMLIVWLQTSVSS